MGNNKRRISSAAIFGVLLIALGVLWALKNTHVIEFEIKQWWPLILIAIGLIHLINRRRFFDFSGWLFLIVGGAFLLTENDVLDRHDVWKFWPVLLILVGLYIIFRGAGRKTRISHFFGKDEHGSPDETSTIGGDRVNESCLFGGYEKRFTSKGFKGGSVSAVFGGIELDLRGAELAEEGGIIDVSAIFGGVGIKIPDSWVIEEHSSAILGGVDYKCSNPRNNSGKRLVINATAIFGGVDIKN
jgi:predicted membrane protein